MALQTINDTPIRADESTSLLTTIEISWPSYFNPANVWVPAGKKTITTTAGTFTVTLEASTIGNNPNFSYGVIYHFSDGSFVNASWNVPTAGPYTIYSVQSAALGGSSLLPLFQLAPGTATTGQVIQFNGTIWAPATGGGGTGGGGATIPSVTNVIKGSGTGNAADTKIAIASPTTAATLAFPSDNATITFQGTDTYIGRATTDTLTNKTLTSPSLITPALGTPSSGVLTNATGLPLATGVTGNLAVAKLNSGTNASATTFWRGDGVWIAPVAGGAAIPSVTNLIAGNGSGNGADSGIAPATVVKGAAALTTAGLVPYIASSGTVSQDAALSFNTGTKRLSAGTVPNVASVADGTSFTPNSDSTDLLTHINTQAIGTLTINAPTGSPASGQSLTIRIKSTNVQTYAWNAIYRGSTDLALAVASTGAAKTDYLKFVWNAADSKWDFLAIVGGF